MSVLSTLRVRLRGMTLIDVLVGSAIMLLIFLALLGLVRASLVISTSGKAKAGATAVMNSQMEYIRSLSYDSIGTLGGIPSGIIPQFATTTMNGIAYGVRTFITYIDDPADGTEASDTNSITTDYKRIKISVSYDTQNGWRDLSSVSSQSPASIESTVGGGTLRIVVRDAVGTAISGASVRVFNTSLAPPIDVTTFSDATGAVLFSGAPTSTQYQIHVTKAGYSSAQTYATDATNVSPTPGYLTVAEGQTTTSSFAIDVLASLTMHTFSPADTGSFTDTFLDTSKLEVLTFTEVDSGELTLLKDSGTYPPSGSAVSTTTTPANLDTWTTLGASVSLPPSTSVVVHVLDGNGALVSDADLAGNSTGFSTFPVSLAGLATTTYPTLGLSADFATSDDQESADIDSWILNYQQVSAPIPNVSFTLTGGKTIGTDSGGAPIYKTIVATTTDASGVRALSLEWDLYQLIVTGYTISDALPDPPYELLPGTATSTTLFLTP